MVFGHLFGASREEMWRKLSAELQGRYVQGSFWKGDRVEAAHGPWLVTLDQHAVSTGDVQGLMDVLAPDVVLITDGGGVKKAALRPILGRDKVLRFLDAVTTGIEAVVDVVEANGAPALRVVVDGELDTVASMVVEDGLVTGLYVVRNPAKLARLDAVVTLTR